MTKNNRTNPKLPAGTAFLYAFRGEIVVSNVSHHIAQAKNHCFNPKQASKGGLTGVMIGVLISGVDERPGQR